MQGLIRSLNKKQVFAYFVLASYMFLGVASLIYQVSWEQAMEKIVGMALPTISLIISLYFLGVALGTYLIGKAQLSAERAGKFFVISQMLLALMGLIFVYTDGLNFLTNLNTNSQKFISVVYSVRLILIGIFISPPTFLIGAAFPLLLGSFYKLRRMPEKLYLANLLGSVIGAILVGFVLLGNFGIGGSVIFAAIINLFSGGIFLLGKFLLGDYSFEEESKKNMASLDFSEDLKQPPLEFYQRRSVLVLLIMGAPFFNMVLELIFVRLFVLFMNSTAFTFSIVLAIQMLALTSGAFIANLVRAKLIHYWKVFTLLYFFAAIWLLLVLLIFPFMPWIAQVGIKFFRQTLAVGPYWSFFCSYFFLVMVVMLVPSMCLGSILPLYFQFREKFREEAFIEPSIAFALNLFSSILGCLFGGIVVIPFLSKISNHAIYFSFLLGALWILAIGFLVFISKRSKQKVKGNILTYICILIIFALFVFYWPIVSNSLLKGKGILTFYKEGVNSTVSIRVYPDHNVACLQTDGQTEASLPIDIKMPADGSDLSTQLLLGYLPGIFSLHSAKNVFLLGLGSGLTLKSILLNPQAEQVSVAELEPCVIEAAQYLESRLLKNWLASWMQAQNASESKARVKIRVADGRNILSILNQSYDVIISQPGEPWRSSSKYLYTLQFWQLAKSRLLPGGIFCQWLPVYTMDEESLLSLCQTFATVFPSTLVIRQERAAELILIAVNQKDDVIMSSGVKDQSLLLTRMIDIIRKDRVSCNFSSIENLCHSLAEREARSTLLNGKLNEDNFPFVQYRLQSLIMQEGIKVNSKIIEAMSSAEKK